MPPCLTPHCVAKDSLITVNMQEAQRISAACNVSPVTNKVRHHRQIAHQHSSDRPCLRVCLCVSWVFFSCLFLVWVSALVQVTDWKDSPPIWPTIFVDREHNSSHWLFCFCRRLLHTTVCKYKSLKADCNVTSAADYFLEVTKLNDRLSNYGQCTYGSYISRFRTSRQFAFRWHF